MIIRIVKLTFHPESIRSFLEIFNAEQKRIASFAGCRKLLLLKDQQNPNVFFTYSEWDHAEALENYRQSALFKSIWANARKHFADRPEAWTLQTISNNSDY
ncbi:MAG: antibiotic biosynthesis monooxygenase [Chitinophagales bacterium]|nr:MAG: antibiotic biosynthesis monooxygenase [Chitinophagales bacterium]